MVPVGYLLGQDGAGATVIAIGGFRLRESAKFRNLVRDRRSIVLHPERVTSWGVDTPPFERQRRRVG